MKKIICILLTVLLLIFPFPLSVSAERAVGGVGGSLVDGVSRVPEDAGWEKPIYVAVRDRINRYAVDLTYPADGISISYGGAVWNVNTHSYESNNAQADVQVFKLQVTNHSDLGILVYASSSLEEPYANKLHVICDPAMDAKEFVAGVPAHTEPGTVTPREIDVSIGLNDDVTKGWGEIFDLVLAENGEDALLTPSKLGVVTVFVEKEKNE